MSTFDPQTIERVYQCAWRTAFSLTRDREQCGDIAQEATARALARWDSIQGYELQWVSRTTTNLIFGLWRRQRVSLPSELVLSGAHVPTPDTGIDLAHALARLPRRQREIVALRYLADMSQEDVATSMSCSVGTVKTQSSRGLAKLRKLLGETYLVEASK